MDCEERGAIWPLDLETRGLSRVIKGYAIVFHRPSERLGWFVEEIAADAVDRTLKDRVDLRALIDHEPGEIIGRMSAGTLRVAKDERGLRVEIDPPNSPRGENIVESIRRRDITGMSFAFQALDVTWNEKVDPPIRTVTDMLVREVSVVSFPAYPQTEAAMRSKFAAARQSWQLYQSKAGRSVTARLLEAESLRRRW
jgi:HK97 family phage prohead protease